MWGATRAQSVPGAPFDHFNPRSPCGERLQSRFEILAGQIISIHAPRVGSDDENQRRYREPVYFNPRSPCGERPGDRPGQGPGIPDFNPRSPCGERQPFTTQLINSNQFQSTLPVWGATYSGLCAGCQYGKFQSTLPVWGATENPAMT